MSKTRTLYLALAACCAAVVSSACGPAPDSAEAATASSVRPAVLRYAYNPSADEPERQTLRLDQLRQYLSEQVGIPVELFRTSGGYGVIIEAMRAKKVDVAQLGPFGYLIASEKAGAEAIVVSGSKATGHGSYRGAIAVARNSPIQSMEELVARSKELTFSFVDPASTSGYLVQRAYLQSLGLDPEHDFKKTMFSMNHLASAMTLLAGKVDAAAVMESSQNRLLKAGKIQPGDIRVLWMSPPLPSSPIAVRSDLPESVKRALQAALVGIPERAPELWAMWPRSNMVPDAILLEGHDSMFDGLREMASKVKNLSLLED